MAYIGLKHPVFAPITSAPAGALPVYGAGLIVGKAISANVTIELADNPLYGDDAIDENDKGFQSGSLTVGLTDLSKEAIVAMFGSLAETVGGVQVVRDAATFISPEGGFGYYRVRRVGGLRKIRAYWYYRTQWGPGSEDATTKGQTIEWQTPTAEGTIMTAADNAQSWRVMADFDNETDAIGWLNEMANVGEPASLTALNTAITAAVALNPETYTSVSWVAVANALATAQEVAGMSSPSQARVDAAKTALTAAQAALVEA